VSHIRDLVIVGGGTAGVGAASEARRLGLDALIVEASDRLGGRAHTIDWRGHKLDLGCGWLHSAERNSLRSQAERIGAEIDRTVASWFDQYRHLGLSPDEQASMVAAFAALEERMRRSPPASDRASDALEPDNSWNAWLNAVSGYINGAPLDQVSVADWLAYDNSSSRMNWRLRGGYGTLVASLGSEFEHVLGTPVTAVTRLGKSIQLMTARGPIEATRVIITVSTAVLANIRFDPTIDPLLEAAEGLPLGLADKLFLALGDADEFPDNAHLIGDPHSSDTGSYMIRPMGMPVIEVYFGGTGANEVERLGLDGATALATDQLSSLLGSGFRKRLAPITLTCWSLEPWIGGSYSHALPGHARARDTLAKIGDDRLSFAGEAVAGGDYSTAHGAYDSGVAAVRRLFPSGRN
jgi:monoamine oxidase